jgi:hypothetical protein
MPALFFFSRASLCLGLGAGLVVACSGKEAVSLGENNLHGSPVSCGSAGGACIGIYPGACQNWGDANAYSCGGGVGTGCCLDSANDGGSPDAASDGSGARDGGSPGNDGGSPSCASNGGQCVFPAPGACPSGTFDDTLSCGSPSNMSCCLPAHDGGGPFVCGTLNCTGGTFCLDQAPGILPPDGGAGGDTYTCSPVPAACASAPTCSCIVPQLGSNCVAPACTADAAGSVTVRCQGV